MHDCVCECARVYYLPFACGANSPHSLKYDWNGFRRLFCAYPYFTQSYAWVWRDITKQGRTLPNRYCDVIANRIKVPPQCHCWLLFQHKQHQSSWLTTVYSVPHLCMHTRQAYMESVYMYLIGSQNFSLHLTICFLAEPQVSMWDTIVHSGVMKLQDWSLPHLQLPFQK